ncbi:MAG: zinc metalloprotease HtpX [Bdellovibrionales bacterium RIFOXYD1_FULL_53_11]|nr:MAG: zinc metalloprotease HtpX [Bdellovibrionales bacterium RIFOXYD1_FULL_53_11]
MWSWGKRIVLFLALNFLIIISLSVLMHVLGVRPYLNAQGLDYNQLIAFCLIWGMGGAFISLALSRIMAKMMMGVKVINPDNASHGLQQLVQTVHHLARSAHLPKMPEVGIYDSPEVNAFATGPTKSRALVAVSTGLLHRMKQDEIEGVLGHEIAHIANGDMVTMTLLQGVVNAFVMFLARVIAFAITMAGRGDREERGGSTMSYFLVQIVLEIVFMILGSIVVAAFSRWREFRADAGGARLAGRDSMINALQALQRTFNTVDPRQQPAVASLKISSRPGGLLRWFSTHPPLEERIERLRSARGR